jgi:hypothetical protein
MAVHPTPTNLKKKRNVTTQTCVHYRKFAYNNYEQTFFLLLTISISNQNLHSIILYIYNIILQCLDGESDYIESPVSLTSRLMFNAELESQTRIVDKLH